MKQQISKNNSVTYEDSISINNQTTLDLKVLCLDDKSFLYICL